MDFSYFLLSSDSWKAILILFSLSYRKSPEINSDRFSRSTFIRLTTLPEIVQ